MKESQLGFKRSLNKFFDRVFELIINNPYPITRFHYWKHLNWEYNQNYESLKKFSKLTKYQKQECISEGKISEVDKFIMSFSPTKRQFEFLSMIINKEFSLKSKYKEGIYYLLQAKDIFEK